MMGHLFGLPQAPDATVQCNSLLARALPPVPSAARGSVTLSRAKWRIPGPLDSRSLLVIITAESDILITQNIFIVTQNNFFWLPTWLIFDPPLRSQFVAAL